VRRLRDGRDASGTFHAVRTRTRLFAVTVSILSTALLAACGGSAATTDSSLADSSTTVASSDTTTTTTAKTPTSSTPSKSGTELELELASINGVTLAAVKLNAALLTKAGWATAAPTTTIAAAPQDPAATSGTSSREASVLLSVLGSSNAPKGYSLKAYGSAGIVEVWDGTKIVDKTLTGLVEYIELSSDDASVCLRPSINGKADGAQQPTENDAYRNLPIGELVQPSNPDGWVIMLRLAGADACRTALDTLRSP
jgi:hypothetical protein